MNLTISDTSATGNIINQITIAIGKERCTLRDIIESRVRAEVKHYNQKLGEYFQGLVQPGESEKALNGFKMKKRKKIDAEQQVYVALDSFQKNGFFVLIDDLQVDNLDHEILVNNTTSINFIKLTSLVGG